MTTFLPYDPDNYPDGPGIEIKPHRDGTVSLRMPDNRAAALLEDAAKVALDMQIHVGSAHEQCPTWEIREAFFEYAAALVAVEAKLRWWKNDIFEHLSKKAIRLVELRDKYSDRPNTRI